MAYQIFFALVPLLLLVTGIFALFLSSDDLRREAAGLLGQIYPGLASRRLVDELVESRALTLGLGSVGTLWSVTAIHAALDRALRAVLGGDRRGFVRTRLQGLLLAVLLAALAVLSFALSFMVRAFADWLAALGPLQSRALELLGPLSGFLAGFALFSVIFLVVPRRRLPRGARLAGAFTAAVLWEIAKAAFGILAREAHVFSAYGALALATGLLTWIYVTAVILLLAAEVVKAWPERAA